MMQTVSGSGEWSFSWMCDGCQQKQPYRAARCPCCGLAADVEAGEVDDPEQRVLLLEALLREAVAVVAGTTPRARAQEFLERARASLSR